MITEQARATASDWHGGMWTALYSLASTGTVWSESHRERLMGEISECATYFVAFEDSLRIEELRQLAHLRRCVRHTPVVKS